MSNPASRDQYKDWCMRQLGWPVVEINIDDDQIEDCVDSALQFFRDFHFDGTEHWYISHQITQEDKDQQYIAIDPNIIGITRVFPVGSTNASVNMFDLRYQLRLHDLYDFTSTSYVNYVLTQQHIRTLDLLFTGETIIRFNRHTHRLNIDWDWNNSIQVGEYLVIDGYQVVDPAQYADVWNDRLFKKLGTAYIKKQWGTNMKKWTGVKMLGGVMMNGQAIHDEAVAEIEAIEAKIESTYQEPPTFFIG
eukprot:gnl/Spiro4/17709_TR9431_c0_g1_i1.p9 gnl/Spiro4/17709_TR9431_c0_g1~~gnl/Spiro4/17709_TR9431_c0_g1_i1.p9  ORF type:complete len:248 (+),score=40.92 gnl/Spiro4/17709_TR9431_c0_g1_i1:7618-8361(+)